MIHAGHILRLMLFLSCLVGGIIAAQPAYHYSIDWKFPNEHYFDIEMVIEKPLSEKIVVRIPAWRPGRYTIQNFSKNIVGFQAASETGKALPVIQLDKDSWQIERRGASKIVISYRYYANKLNAGDSYLDDQRAHINPVTLLMYQPGQEHLPLTCTIARPADWKIATVLPADKKRTNTFRAASYHELADSPIYMSADFKQYSFESGNTKVDLIFQTEQEIPLIYLLATQMIVDYQASIFGGLPFERYLFIYQFLDKRFGHGVEHRNSTSIVLGPADLESKSFYKRFLGITSHEFFHVWNVERIRPSSIYHPDYSKEQYSSDIWFYEGVTSYYEKLTLLRTGLIGKIKYYDEIERRINRLRRKPGRLITSAAAASWNSWSKQGHYPPGTAISVYNKGYLLGLLLDLEIRRRSGGKKSLDDVMRYLYQEYALKNKGVPEGGIREAIATVSGSSFERFFRDYVEGTEPLDYQHYLSNVGLILEFKEPTEDEEPYSGIVVEDDSEQSRIRSIAPDSPALKAGLDRTDILLAVNGRQAHSGNFKKLLSAYQAGDTLQISVFRRQKLMTFEMILAEQEYRRGQLREDPQANDRQIALRRDWLGILGTENSSD